VKVVANLRVVIVDDDVFADGGGGQTFYRKLILDHPEIDFTYFIRNESAAAVRPANARVVPVGDEPRVQLLQPLFAPLADALALRRALAYASAIAGQEVDLIDAPDYKTFGPYLRQALLARAVRTRALVHSMHGVISDSITRDWDGIGLDALDLRDLELRQYIDADARYAISASYAEEWRARTSLAPDVIDPSRVLQARAVVASLPDGGTPEILCVGRRERRKGNDIATEVVAWMDPKVHRGLRHVGAPSPAGKNRSGDDILAEASRARGIPWLAVGPLSQDALFDLYRQDSVVLAPVRYDTFNLTVLEAASVGVPVAVSRDAGVSHYLRSFTSPVPVLIVDHERPEAIAQAMNAWLVDYPSLRRRSIEFAERLQTRIGALDLRGIYDRAISAAQTRPAKDSALNFLEERAATSLLENGLITRTVTEVREFAYSKRHSSWLRGPYKVLRRYVRGADGPPASVQEMARQLNAMPERTSTEVDLKIALASRFEGRASGRCTVWSEMARLERLRGGELRAATYDIRTIRLTGRDPFGRLPLVQAALEAEGMAEVARAIGVVHGPGAVPSDVTDLLAHRRARLRDINPLSKAVVSRIADTRKGDRPAEISILVSLFNVGTKLTRFLSQLSRQTAAQEGRVELVFVDASSSLDDSSVALAAAEAGPFKDRVVYIHASSRISIQAAWNVALQHSRGEFITCLGVDETLYPVALSSLAAAMRSNPCVDWAMSSSIVGEVNARGAPVRDKMFYDRDGATRDMTMLDTTYLSWVGGLYRRSVHERFGYYDPDFRAAGDTEFKNRILPYINVCYVPGTLGIFQDYPEERASAGVRAELEDSLAWYLFRTPSGAASLLDRCSTSELESIVRWCAGLRKCYKSKPSSDVEFGIAASAALAARPDTPSFAAGVASIMMTLRQTLRRYDFTDRWRDPNQTPAKLQACFSQYATTFMGLVGNASAFEGFNDNRFEQHSWAWSGD